MSRNDDSQQAEIQATIAYGMGTTLPEDPRNLDCDDTGLISVSHQECADTLRKNRAEAGQRAERALRLSSE
jgi:hypothetical protein